MSDKVQRTWPSTAARSSLCAALLLAGCVPVPPASPSSTVALGPGPVPCMGGTFLDPPGGPWKWLRTPPPQAELLRKLVAERHPNNAQSSELEEWFRGVEDDAVLLCTLPGTARTAYKAYVFLPDGDRWTLLDLGEPVIT
jgi:hypothetical protein